MIIKFYKKFGDTFKKLSKKDKIIKCKDYLSKMSKMSYNFDRAKWYMLLKDIAYMGNIIVNNKFYFPNLDLNITVNDNYPFLKERKYDSIRNASEYFNKTKGIILNKDYREVLKLVKKGDFVFLDPPYIEEHNYQFNYNIDEKINDNFVETLLKEVKKLDTRGVKWMMTQSNTPFVRKVFKKYTIKTFQAYRRAKKGFSSEAVIMNYIPNSQNTKKSIKKVERKSTKKSIKKVERKSTKKSKKKSTKKSKKKSTKKVERKSTKKIKRKSTKKSTKKIKRKSTKKVERKSTKKSTKKIKRKSTKKIFPRGLPKLPKKYTKNV
jgi:site-specific DNA-adenine methylase